MNQKVPFDLRVSNFLLRSLKNYKKKRQHNIQKKKDREWINLFGSNSSLTHHLTDDIRIKLYRDSILSGMIYDGFEESEIGFLQKVLREGDIFFDVGANIGLFSLYAASLVGKDGKVWAFEPAPITFSRLKENILLNDFVQVETLNIGISDKAGEEYLHISEDGRDGWNTFANGNADLFSAGMNVTVDSLDNFVVQHNIDISKIKLIKIDVEGWEVPVIKGMKKIMRENNNAILLAEFTQKNSLAAGFNCYQLYDLVSDMGFSWFSYNSQKNLLFPEKKRVEYPYINLIATGNVEALSRYVPVRQA